MFISTQGPTKNTISNFWKMIYLNKVNTIMMLCNIFEDTRIKCDQYWPDKVGAIQNYSNFVELEFLSETKILDDLVIQRKFKLKYYEENQKEVEAKEVSQFHVVCWPDHSIPQQTEFFKLFDFLCNIIFSNYTKARDSDQIHSPTVVHCSAGIGRTGTLISIFNLFDHFQRQLLYQKNKKNEMIKAEVSSQQLDNDFQSDLNQISCNQKIDENNYVTFSIFSIVRKLREQRFMFVTDLCQYKIIYKFAYLFIKKYFYGITLLEEVNLVESPVLPKIKPIIVKEQIVLSTCLQDDNSSKKDDSFDLNNSFEDCKSYNVPPTTKSKRGLVLSFDSKKSKNTNFNNSFTCIKNTTNHEFSAPLTTKGKGKEISFTKQEVDAKASKFYSNMELAQINDDDEGNYENNMTPSDSAKKVANHFNFYDNIDQITLDLGQKDEKIED